MFLPDNNRGTLIVLKNGDYIFFTLPFEIIAMTPKEGFWHSPPEKIIEFNDYFETLNIRNKTFKVDNYNVEKPTPELLAYLEENTTRTHIF